MPTTTQSTSKAKKRAATSKGSATGCARTAARSKDAVALLEADHREVEKLFADYQKARSNSRKAELSAKICTALKAHTTIEEEYFYPTSRQFLDDDEIVDEAVVEHQAAKDLIAEIEGMQVGDELYDAKVKVLSEMIEHHVEEEEEEYFPKVRKTEMDLKGIGEQMAQRKQELMAEMGATALH